MGSGAGVGGVESRHRAEDESGSFTYDGERAKGCRDPIVLEGECHDAPCSSSSHQALDVGCGQGEDQALLSAQVPACVEGDEDGLVHAWRRPRHHATYCIGQLLCHQERLQDTHTRNTHAETHPQLFCTRHLVQDAERADWCEEPSARPSLVLLGDRRVTVITLRGAERLHPLRHTCDHSLRGAAGKLLYSAWQA
ncbi:hypothetical protein INR49_012003 [Caranx melampygus]|nr:hypothetical protein INR49_012003 [Caranx melampygus]